MKLFNNEQVQLTRRGVRRRGFLQAVAGSSIAAGTLSFRDAMSLHAAELRKEQRAVILLWMAGGPSQFETFDPKPHHENGGETKAISTSVPGIEVAEHWPETAKVMDQFAVLRSMTNREGNHRRASYQMHTGYVPSGSVKHPSLASNITKELADASFDIPSFVSVGRPEAGAGFLGVDYDPFVVTNPGTMPSNATPQVNENRFQRRLGLLDELEQEFSDRGGKTVVKNHRGIYGKASKMVVSPHLKAFDFSDESDALKAAYGDNEFGKGCLLARRLVERGATFVEVRSNGWDTHFDHFERISELSSQVDPAMSTLVTDLKERGMLDKTLVIWMGEFGRTPRVNPRGGRDHYPRVFNALMAGGGVRGGQVIGGSTADGTAVEDQPIEVEDLFQSICHSVKIDASNENISPLGRPMKIVDGGEVIPGLFG